MELTQPGAASQGTSTTPFTELFLASGGVANWNSGTFTITNSGSALLFANAATSGGDTMVRFTPGNHTAVTANKINQQFMGNTITITGSYTPQSFTVFEQPTITAGSALAVTTAATVVIANAPAAAGSATITNSYALLVQNGQSLFGGNLTVSGSSALNGSASVNLNATSGGNVTFATTPGNHTGVTEATENHVFGANSITVTGAISTQFFTAFDQPTISAATSQTVSLAGNVIISGAPVPAGAGPATVTATAALIVDGGVMATAGAATTITDAAAIILTPPFKATNVTVTTSHGLLERYATPVTQPNVIIGANLDFDTNYTTSASALTGVKISIDGTNTTNKKFVDYYKDTSSVYSVDINGNLTAVGLQCDSITNDTGLASGTYTPTRSAEANMDSNVTMTEAQYMRVGNTVTVSGRFTADPTLTATATSFEITLPVASNIGAVEDAAGTAFCGTIAGMGAEVIGVVANDTAKIQWVASDVTSKVWSYIFSYQVI